MDPKLVQPSVVLFPRQSYARLLSWVVAFFILLSFGLFGLAGIFMVRSFGTIKPVQLNPIKLTEKPQDLQSSNLPLTKIHYNYRQQSDLQKIKFDIPVLTYHYVENIPADQAYNSIAQGLRVSPAVFEQQLQTLQKNNFTTLTTDEYEDILLGQKPRPEKPILLTFDDGYKDNFENAFPLLKKYGMKGNFALISSVMGTMDYMSYDDARLMAEAGMGIMSHTTLHCMLASRKKEQGKIVIEPNNPDTAEKPCAEFTSSKPLTIGQVRYELRQSKEELESKLGVKVNAIVYPYGVFNQQTIEEALSAGYEVGFTTLGRTPQDYQNTNLVIPRIDIHGQQTGGLTGYFKDHFGN